jgi:short subunit dehydrogenase-like uncharacterized protein
MRKTRERERERERDRPREREERRERERPDGERRRGSDVACTSTLVWPFVHTTKYNQI